MTEKVPSIDPVIFEENMTVEFGLALTSQVDVFVKANEIIENYGKNSGSDSSTTLGGVLGNTLARYSEETDRTSLVVGDITVIPMGDDPGEPVTLSLQEIVEGQYEQALVDKCDSSRQLIEYLQGLQLHISNQLEGLVDPGSVPEKSWELAWKKVRETIRSMGGGSLADVVDFFDSLVELQYPSTFDPTKRNRSREVGDDISARMFYVVMEPHLKRASMRRGKDNWA
jgi:hypothetical protein